MIIIQGTKVKSEYQYDGGSENIEPEINAFFAKNPTLNTGAHNLIILPAFFLNADGTANRRGPYGPPLYASGKNGYAVDYPEMDLKYMGTSGSFGESFTYWFTALLHELGHAMNLSHNREKVTEARDPMKGTALMSGTGQLGRKPTFLTPADAAILNTNQLFNTDQKSYYTAVNTELTAFYANYNEVKRAIVVSGKFKSTGQVKSVLFYNDPILPGEGTTVIHDYNAIAWETKVIGTDSFYVEMPISDLFFRDDGLPYMLNVRFVHDNGVVSNNGAFRFVYQGRIPIIEYNCNFEEKPNQYSKNNWLVTSFSSQQTYGDNGIATNIIDRDYNTSWMNRWGPTLAVHPHYVTIWFGGSSHQITGFSISQALTAPHYSKDIELLTSMDGKNWLTAGNYVLKNTPGIQHLYLPEKRTVNYFKLVINSGWDGTPHASIAEISAFN